MRINRIIGHGRARSTFVVQTKDGPVKCRVDAIPPTRLKTPADVLAWLKTQTVHCRLELPAKDGVRAELRATYPGDAFASE